MAGKSKKKTAAKKLTAKKTGAKKSAKPAAKQVAAKGRRNTAPSDWRAEALSRIRRLIKEALPNVVEEVKWRKPSNPAGVPVWSHDGMICTGETYKDKVKITFAKGASLEDPAGLFNASLDGNARRAIDLYEGDAIHERAFKSLIRAAAALNAAKSNKRPSATTAKPKLLSGGNPQIAKADGDAPVQAYIAAMPGWKRDVGRRLDALMERIVPDVRKAVRWNSPFYGVEDQGWFLSYHCMTKYIKVTFLRGASLRPAPPIESKHPEVRYFHIHENDQLDEELMANWIKQASQLPGDPLF